MENQRVLILGNKPYHNLNLNDIIDSFDVIYRFNLAWPGKNCGTKFGNLVMCNHMYHNFVKEPSAGGPALSKEQAVQKYGHETETEYLKNWYDFFQENKQNFEKIFYESSYGAGMCNSMLEKYGCPHRFSKVASSGYSIIFKNLHELRDVYVLGFTLCSDELRKTSGEKDEYTKGKNEGRGCHSFLEETRILAWLHNNGKVDASLCMLEDSVGTVIKSNSFNTEPSEFILNLLNKG